MSLGLTHLSIDDSTTIQNSILDSQEAPPNGKNIIGTINKIIDTAGTGGGGGTDYQESASIGITQEKKLFVACEWGEVGVSKHTPMEFQYVNRAIPNEHIENNVIQLIFDASTWGGYADLGCACDLVDPTYPCYKCISNFMETKTKIQWWTINGEDWSSAPKAQWARGFVIWSATEARPPHFYDKLHFTVEDTKEMKTVYNIKENAPFDISGLKLRFAHDIDKSVSDRNAFYCKNNLDLPYFVHYDTSHIDFSKPGTYPLYVWPMFTTNKTAVPIEVKE